MLRWRLLVGDAKRLHMQSLWAPSKVSQVGCSRTKPYLRTSCRSGLEASS